MRDLKGKTLNSGMWRLSLPSFFERLIVVSRVSFMADIIADFPCAVLHPSVGHFRVGRLMKATSARTDSYCEQHTNLYNSANYLANHLVPPNVCTCVLNSSFFVLFATNSVLFLHIVSSIHRSIYVTSKTANIAAWTEKESTSQLVHLRDS